MDENRIFSHLSYFYIPLWRTNDVASAYPVFYIAGLCEIWLYERALCTYQWQHNFYVGTIQYLGVTRDHNSMKLPKVSRKLVLLPEFFQAKCNDMNVVQTCLWSKNLELTGN